MRNMFYTILDYCEDHRWTTEVMYWGGFAAVVFNTSHKLDSWPYFCVLTGSVFMHWGGLITGARMTREVQR